jgi:hypothetical protein
MSDVSFTLVIFYARNGDRVLVRRRTGEIAWWMLAEGRIEVRWKTVEDFARSYAKNLKTRSPFDSYA